MKAAFDGVQSSFAVTNFITEAAFDSVPFSSSSQEMKVVFDGVQSSFAGQSSEIL
jgi:hypothetical protein